VLLVALAIQLSVAFREPVVAYSRSLQTEEAGYLFFYRTKESDSDPTIYLIKPAESVKLAILAESEFFALELPPGAYSFSWTRVPSRAEKFNVTVRSGQQIWVRVRFREFAQVSVNDTPKDNAAVSPIPHARVYSSSVLIPQRGIQFNQPSTPNTNGGRSKSEVVGEIVGNFLKGMSNANQPLSSTTAFSNSELLLFGENGSGHKAFLGCLNCGRYDAGSICNRYGNNGSRYGSDSIWNPYGEYGSRYSSRSPWNKYATDPPVIVDRAGNFFGYLTSNRFHDRRTNSKPLLTFLDNPDFVNEDLSRARDLFCGN
jgi:hypothetical protein